MGIIVNPERLAALIPQWLSPALRISHIKSLLLINLLVEVANWELAVLILHLIRSQSPL